MGLDEVDFEEAVPAKPEAKKEGVLYTSEIDAAIKEAKADSGDLGKMKSLQTFLKEKGYWDYNITGEWTATLEKALREFYQDYVKKE